MNMTEQQITKMMSTLKISREEAIDLIREDEEIDRMSMSEVDNDLTPEEKKAKKKATNTTGDKTKRSYTFTKRERKPDDVKREIIDTIAHNLDRACCGEDLVSPSNIQIVKPEKEITFELFGEAYSVTLTKHRKPKA
jgi:hypothetical protein